MKTKWISVVLVVALTIGLWGVAGCTRHEKKKETQNPVSEENAGGVLLAKAGKPGEKGKQVTGDFIAAMAGGKMAKEILQTKLPGNRVYSPITLSMMMAMLTDASSGQARQEILKLMGWKSLEDVKKQVRSVYAAANRKTENGETRMANAIWLRDDESYHEEKIAELADDFFADSFSGKMGSAEYDKFHQTWLNEQTKDLLSDEVKKMNFIETQKIALSCAGYFRQQWPEKMDLIKKNFFWGRTGATMVDMLEKEDTMPFYRGENYKAVGLPFHNGFVFWLFLPDSEYSVEDVLVDNRYLSIMKGEIEPEDTDAKMVVRFPKFDITTSLDAAKGIANQSYLQIFDDRGAFRELTDGMMYVSGIPHATRILVDEYGATAATFAEAELKGAYMPEDAEYFICNRPFFYAIADENGMVYYEGIMQQGEKITDTEVKIRQPIVKVNGQIYVKTDEVAKVTCGTADGRIRWSEEPGKVPINDDSSNFGEGYRYQYADEHHLSVEIDGIWYAFERVSDISTLYYKTNEDEK
ncbi:MAG: hypothetical protein E7277_01395 [Lachnospiraceae bacterium]|nr:hypothetical protein [Lachnospiraceae bacterium]